MAARGERIVGLRKTLERLGAIGAVNAQPAFEEVGAYVIAQILMRTSQGRDVTDRFFKGYSPTYKAWRAAKGLPTNRVDLFVTGSMMGSVDSKAEQTRVTIFIRPGEDPNGVSNPAKAAWLNKRRRWFAISQKDRERARQLLVARLMSMARQTG
jgi:hypothetical protein